MPTSCTLKSLLGGLALAAASVAWAQQTVPIFGLVELSGTGATSGSNFDNGVKLAVKEITLAAVRLRPGVSAVATTQLSACDTLFLLPRPLGEGWGEGQRRIQKLQSFLLWFGMPVRPSHGHLTAPGWLGARLLCRDLVRMITSPQRLISLASRLAACSGELACASTFKSRGFFLMSGQLSGKA
jgi:hypothetical protein